MHIKYEGSLSVVSGASRNGKSAYTMRELENFEFALAWDVDEEYAGNGFVKANGIADLINIIKQKGSKPLRVACVPKDLGEFDDFCKIALAWAKDIRDNKLGQLGVVVEETADVTTPSKAPANFRILIGRGMKLGISLFCVTQRPSESDKTSLGNAKNIITFYMTRAADRDYMAREIGCDASDIEELDKLHYLKKDVDNRKIVAGKLEF